MRVFINKSLVFMPNFRFLWLIAAVYLLNPLIQDGSSDWYSLVILVILSTFLVMKSDSVKTDKLPLKPQAFAMVAALSYLLHISFSIDKLAYVTAVFLIMSFLAPKLYSFNSQLLTLICLCLLIPLPYGLESTLGIELAYVEAAIFVEIAQFLNLDIFRLGAQVVSGAEAVTINTSCSGMLLIIPSMLGMCVVASYKSNSVIQSITILLFALPFAFLLNLVRIGLLVVLNFEAEDQLVDSFHDLLGWIVLSVVWALPVWGVMKSHQIEMEYSQIGSIFTGAVIVIASVFTFSLFNTKDIKAFDGAFNVPFYIEGWIGEDVVIDPEEMRILNSDFVIRRVYENYETSRKVEVTYIYHSDAIKGARHSTAKCFLSLGWSVTIQDESLINQAVPVRYYKVDSHQLSQSVIEIIMPESVLISYGLKGLVRVQIVESVRNRSKAERQKTAEDFLYALFKPLDSDGTSR